MNKPKLSRLKKAILFVVIFSIILCGYSNTADAAEKYQLRTLLESQIVYYSTTIDKLCSDFQNKKDEFITLHNGEYVVISGRLDLSSVSGKKGRLYGTTQDSYVDFQAPDKKDLSNLTVNSYLTLYGRIDVTGIKNKSITIKAVHVKTGYLSTDNRFLTYGNESNYPTIQVNDIYGDKHVTYEIPESWAGRYISTPLTNNGITGHQYNLNALPPQNAEDPEIFYIFYFNYTGRLTKPSKTGYSWNIHDIEKRIIQNIQSEITEDKWTSIDSFITGNNLKIDYYSAVYNEKYYAEYFFIPDQKGITCMLYLYYPIEEKKYRAINDVAFLIETIRSSMK